IKNMVNRDYTTYSGTVLENYFIEKLKTEKAYNNIGTYWESNHTNEIDIVAVNDTTKTVLFTEVKRQKENISLSKLKTKTLKLQKQFKGYRFSFKALA